MIYLILSLVAALITLPLTWWAFYNLGKRDGRNDNYMEYVKGWNAGYREALDEAAKG